MNLALGPTALVVVVEGRRVETLPKQPEAQLHKEEKLGTRFPRRPLDLLLLALLDPAHEVEDAASDRRRKLPMMGV